MTKNIQTLAPSRIQIDQYLGRYLNDFIQEVGPLHSECLDIIVFFALNGKGINSNLFHQFNWTTTEFISKINENDNKETARTRLQRDYNQILNEDQITLLKLKYGDWTQKEHYEWIKTILDLSLFILQQAKLTYGLKTGNKYIIDTYSIITNIQIEVIDSKKIYSCNVDPGFVERCTNSLYNVLADYSKVPKKFKNLHVNISELKERCYYNGSDFYIAELDKIAEICGVESLSQENRFLKKFVNKKLTDYLNQNSFQKTFESFTWVKGKNSNFLYRIRFYFGIDSKLQQRVFNYKKNEDFASIYYKGSLIKLFDSVQKYRKDSSLFLYEFEDWYKDSMATGADKKHTIFAASFKKIYNVDVFNYPYILEKEFGYIPKL